jgi:WD40 repeat protein
MISSNLVKITLLTFFIICQVALSKEETTELNSSNNLEFLSDNSNTEIIDLAINKMTTSYNLLKSFKAHYNSIDALIETRSGMLVSGSYDNTFKIWDPRRDFSLVKEVNGVEDDRDWMSQLLELNNGMIASGQSMKIYIWNPLDNYKLFKTISAHNGMIQSLILLSNGLMASSSDDSTVKIWDPNNNFALVQTIKGHTASVTSLVEISEQILVSASYDKTIKFWDMKNNYTLVNTINHMAYSLVHSEGIIAFGSTNSTVKVIDPKQNFSLLKTLEGHSSGVIAMVSFGNGLFASGSRDGLIKIWDKNSNYECIQTIDTKGQQGVTSLLLLRNGNLVSGHYDEIKVWTNSPKKK